MALKKKNAIYTCKVTITKRNLLELAKFPQTANKQKLFLIHFQTISKNSAYISFKSTEEHY